MHRTQTRFEDAFTLKVFIFQFVNFYSSPIYIGFFKGRFVGYPGSYHTLFGVRNEECAAGGCLIELAQELLVIMVGKQIINNVQEILVPPSPCCLQTAEQPAGGAKAIFLGVSTSRKFTGWWQKFRLRSKKRKVGASAAASQTPWEADYELLPCEGLFDEYLEMVLQFGFVTIFVAACPLAPLFALLNNWVEIRLDARKFVCERRRPVAERAQDVGIWFPILAGITHLAVISNHQGGQRWRCQEVICHDPHTKSHISCRYRAFREDDGHYSGTYWNLLAIRLAFVIVFEHVVFSIGRILDLLVPDIPESVQIKVKREYYLAKQALAENEALLGTNGAKDDQPSASEESMGPQPRRPEASRASPVPSL
ncbi:Anoctamin-7 [Myotis brandtii]|uniref:Anoctamin n=1 Tax=Myotis brandtii TaxID=109478 RepID=S7P4D0_MYOBR|nr:Anoctamin-7 [Myotis brandtii]